MLLNSFPLSSASLDTLTIQLSTSTVREMEFKVSWLNRTLFNILGNVLQFVVNVVTSSVADPDTESRGSDSCVKIGHHLSWGGGGDGVKIGTLQRKKRTIFGHGSAAELALQLRHRFSRDTKIFNRPIDVTV